MDTIISPLEKDTKYYTEWIIEAEIIENSLIDNIGTINVKINFLEDTIYHIFTTVIELLWGIKNLSEFIKYNFKLSRKAEENNEYLSVVKLIPK